MKLATNDVSGQEYRDDYTEDQIVDEADADSVVPAVRYDISSYGIDFDVKGLVERLRDEKVYVPEFQRSFVWSLPDASRFVESLLLGLPVPGVFLAKEPATNRLFVIDGQQRLKSLQYFYDGVFNPREDKKTQRSFRLSKVQAQFENKSYKTLEERDRQLLDDSVIHATVVKQDAPEDDDTSIYHVYERLNSGGRRLHPQEIRTAICSGAVIEGVRKANDFEPWRELFGQKSPRLKDEEMILRFLALYEDQASYQRPMEEFLTKFARRKSRASAKDMAVAFALFSNTMSQIRDVLGNKAFRPERNFNAAVFDAISVGLAKRMAKVPGITASALKAAYRSLLADEDFIEATSRSTADKAFVDKRLRLAEEAFARAK